MCRLITQHNARDVANFGGAYTWHADCRSIHRAHELNVHFFIISCPQRQYVQSASQPQFTCNHTSHVPPQTVRNYLRKVNLHAWYLHRGPIIVTDLSGQTFTFNGVWHLGEVFSLQLWRDVKTFYCSGKTADSLCVVTWIRNLLMLMLWMGWRLVTVWLWYGQVHVINNKHKCILVMAYWMHRDTVKKSWGTRLLCHSSNNRQFMLQHDNAQPHIASLCILFLEAEIMATPRPTKYNCKFRVAFFGHSIKAHLCIIHPS